MVYSSSKLEFFLGLAILIGIVALIGVIPSKSTNGQYQRNQAKSSKVELAISQS